MNRTLAISAANRIAELPRLAGAVGAFLAAARVPGESVETVRLVLDELFSNVVRWAYDDDGKHVIEVRVAVEPEGVRVTIEDDGRAFDPLSAPTPDVRVPPSCRHEGGLGIHLVRTLTDPMTYRRVGGRNVVEAVVAAAK
jgi:serine/threonine-protein kinase RsbW